MKNLWDYRPRVWDYREATWTLDRDLDGYDVQATDGCVGTIDRAITEAVGRLRRRRTRPGFLGRRG